MAIATYGYEERLRGEMYEQQAFRRAMEAQSSMLNQSPMLGAGGGISQQPEEDTSKKLLLLEEV